MLAGHIGAALIIARVERRINVGALIFAALLLDVVLWLLVIVGLESVSIPRDFAVTHLLQFNFPYSHGLLASLVLSVLASVFVVVWCPDLQDVCVRVAAVVSLAVFSHWLLDVLVHLPQLPLLGPDSVKVGLGLWKSMPLALAVETAIVLLGLCLYLPAARMTRLRKIGFTALSLLVVAFTLLGMSVAPAPPSAIALAVSSELTIIMVCGLFFWLARRQE